MIFFSNKSRPYHFGPYPLERLARDPGGLSREIDLPRISRPSSNSVHATDFAKTIDKYHHIFHGLRDNEPAPEKAPVPADLTRRMIDIKGSAYFLNASQVGICELTDSCWYTDASPLNHNYAIVIVVEHPRQPENGTLANSWVEGVVKETADFRAYEVAISVANHIQMMGFSATAHDHKHGDVDLERLTVMSGLGMRNGGRVVNPYLDERYSVCAVTTAYALAMDLPLDSRATKNARGIAYALGVGGATSGLERWRQNNRATHLSKFAMETVDKVDRPTTLIIDDEVPRVPKRASFFDRAIHGDLGEKHKRSVVDSRSSTRLQTPC